MAGTIPTAILIPIRHIPTFLHPCSPFHLSFAFRLFLTE
jgi:hypothetical protein